MRATKGGTLVPTKNLVQVCRGCGKSEPDVWFYVYPRTGYKMKRCNECEARRKARAVGLSGLTTLQMKNK